MDPFYDVYEDAQHQHKNLQEFIDKITQTTDDNKTDFQNNVQELQETIEDLKESVETVKNDTEFFQVTPQELSKRERIVHELEESYNRLLSHWNDKLGSMESNNPFVRYDEPESRANPLEDEAHQNFQQQEILREQDQHLDGVYSSMQTINQQARTMGNELEEQAYILDDLEQDLDRVGSKVTRGLKRVEHVIRTNQEKASDCCIALLIVALVVLLVMVIIA